VKADNGHGKLVMKNWQRSTGCEKAANALGSVQLGLGPKRRRESNVLGTFRKAGDAYERTIAIT
jgi:hypothetical protein